MKQLPLKILMFGWEWPPFNSGGLGVACFGLTRALADRGAGITFVLPEGIKAQEDFLQFVFHQPHLTGAHGLPAVYEEPQREEAVSFQKAVSRYSRFIHSLIGRNQFDLIHAHDWMSFAGAVAAKRLTNKPLVVHIHSTIFDRTGGQNINQEIYEAEKQGMEAANLIIAVSQFTKDKIIKHYNIPQEKIRVLHNGLATEEFQPVSLADIQHLKGKRKMVLFIGRITLQKGPDYFFQLAKKILESEPKTLFIIAGSGDMERQIIGEVAASGLTDKFLFAGFVRGEERNKLYRLADVYVMPSVSEPFGITALEALACGVPAIISKQSGVAETVRHILKVDFWDINEMAQKTIAVLRYKSLRRCLVAHGIDEARRQTWDKAAEKCHNIYQEVI